MALQSKTITLGAETDSGNGGKNYVENKPVYIKTSSGTLATIYADINGSTEIVQDGLQNRTNAKGQFTFFAEQGDYLAEYEGQQTPLSIYGADYFNSRIDESVAKITADVALSRGYNRKGTFASGFTYELANDVGIDADDNAWVYTDIDALPVTVNAGTVPSEPVYTPVSLSDAESVKNTDGSSSQDAYNATKALLVAQGLSGNYGFFEKGFTYNNTGDVGIDSDGVMWTYKGVKPFYVDGSVTPTEQYYSKVVQNLNKDSVYPEKTVIEAPHLVYRPNIPNSSILDPNLVYVVGASESEAGYNLYVLKDNVTTTNDSLATTNEDQTMMRVTGVLSAVWAAVGFNIPTSTAGTWTRTNLNQVPPMPSYTNSLRYQYYTNTSNSNESITYENVEVIDGLITMTFVNTASSNPATKVSINGTDYTLDLTEDNTSLKTYTFIVSGSGGASVTITNESSGVNKVVNFVGFWFCELKDWKESPVDTFGYYRDTNVWGEYLDNNSENDYVIKEYNSDIYGGGYHGGESSIINTFYDGSSQFEPNGTPVVSSRMRLVSSSSIDWNPIGQNTIVSVEKEYNFTVSGYYSTISISGDFEAKELYSSLFGINEDFSSLKVPRPYNLNSDVANLERLRIGRVNSAKFENPATNQVFEANITLSQDYGQNKYDGVFIWRVDGSYKKLYYTPVHTGYVRFSNGHTAVNRYLFK